MTYQAMANNNYFYAFKQSLPNSSAFNTCNYKRVKSCAIRIARGVVALNGVPTPFFRVGTRYHTFLHL